jgi:Cu(I)/Ag(I) efflux system membrane fusion protein
MSHIKMKLAVLGIALAGLGIGGGMGYWLAGHHPYQGAMMSGQQDANVLYWYDPMKPDQHFDKPGKSPFMDMQLVAKYAADGADPVAVSTLKIDPGITQNLGVRVVAVARGMLSSGITVNGSIQLNDRQVAILQARSNGFVERVYARAAGDMIAQGAPIVDLLMPEWASAQIEYLAVLNMGDPTLIHAAKQRLLLLGMPADLIALVERSRKTQATLTLSVPIGGVIQDLDVRQGMTVSAGQSLVKINGLDTVWLEAAVPEAQAGVIEVGSTVEAHLTAYAGESVHGKVIAVLPDFNAESRTLRVRIELPNPKGRLKPGMYAQVDLHPDKTPAQLLIPEEAVIRTGTRNVVILAINGGHFQPVDVQLGQSANGKIVILSGLEQGQKVVASGQFLIDSESSLQGVLARMNTAHATVPESVSGSTMMAPTAMPKPISKPAVTAPHYQGVGKVESISATDITISHHPIPAIGWGAMTMTFKLPEQKIAAGVKAGDQVNFGFNQIHDDYVIAVLDKAAGSNPQGSQP